MKRRLLVLVGIVGIGIVLTASPKASALSPPKPAGAQAAEWDRLLQIAGMSENWRRFLALEARKESRFSPNVFLGRPDLQPLGTVLSKQVETLGEGEWRAARNLYRSTEYLSSCPWDEDRYSVAGGIVGLLAANAVRPYRGTSLECIDPWLMFDLREAVPMAYGHALRLLKSRKPTTWLEMASAWGVPGRTHDPERLSDLRIRLKRHLDALGIPLSWLDMKIEPLPDVDLVALRALVLGAIGYAEPLWDERVSGVPAGLPLVWMYSGAADRRMLAALPAVNVRVCAVDTRHAREAIRGLSERWGGVDLAAMGDVAGAALLEGCSGGRVQSMYLIDPSLSDEERESFDRIVSSTPAEITAWCSGGGDPHRVGASLARASRHARILSVGRIESGDLTHAWPVVMEARMRVQEKENE